MVSDDSVIWICANSKVRFVFLCIAALHWPYTITLKIGRIIFSSPQMSSFSLKNRDNHTLVALAEIQTARWIYSMKRSTLWRWVVLFESDATAFLYADGQIIAPCAQQREKVPDDYAVVDPEHKLIYRFIRTLFSSAQLTAECAIVTLVSANNDERHFISICVTIFHPVLGVPGEAADVRRDGHLSLQLEAHRPRRHLAGLQGVGWPSRVERWLLPDPQRHHRGGHVSIKTQLLTKN